MTASTVPAPDPTTAGQRNFRSSIRFYLIDCSTLPGKLIDILIIALNLAVCAILVVETYPMSAAAQGFMWRAEIVIVGIFIIEYLARLYAARNRMRQMRDIYSIIDLVTILPTLILFARSAAGFQGDLGALGVLRGLRIFRVLRFFRFTADADFFFGRITNHLLRVRSRDFPGI